jgi:hypothetical protein
MSNRYQHKNSKSVKTNIQFSNFNKKKVNEPTYFANKKNLPPNQNKFALQKQQTKLVEDVKPVYIKSDATDSNKSV